MAERRETAPNPLDSNLMADVNTSILGQIDADVPIRMPSPRENDYNFFLIASHLRTNFSEEDQRSILVKAFGPEGTNFHNGEKLGTFISEINNINWYQPEQEPDISTIKVHSDAYLRALNLEPIPIKLIRGDWEEAQLQLMLAERRDKWKSQSRKAWGVASEAGMFTAEYASLNIERVMAIRAARAAVNSSQLPARDIPPKEVGITTKVHSESTAVHAAEWIVLENLKSENGFENGNPLIPFMEIYKIGAWPIGEVGVRRKYLGEKHSEFLVFIPEVTPDVPQSA